jgi:hypothetical protein
MNAVPGQELRGQEGRVKKGQMGPSSLSPSHTLPDNVRSLTAPGIQRVRLAAVLHREHGDRRKMNVDVRGSARRGPRAAHSCSHSLMLLLVAMCAFCTARGVEPGAGGQTWSEPVVPFPKCTAGAAHNPQNDAAASGEDQI